MKRFLLALPLLLVLACSQPQPVTVQCPENSTCDVNVTPPPMSAQEIQYHADHNDLTEDVLVALMVQDMMWRNCWDCYGGYYSRYPTLYTQHNYYYSLPPQQRYQKITNNYTYIQQAQPKIEKAKSAEPSNVSSTTLKSTGPKPNTTTGQNGGTGGGNASTNKAPDVPKTTSSSNTTSAPRTVSPPSTSSLSSRSSSPPPSAPRR